MNRQDDRFLHEVFEQAAVGIALVAPNGSFVRVNRKLCDIFGYAPDELLGKRFQEITFPDDLTDSLTFARRMLDREPVANDSLEKRYVCKDGRIVWVKLTVTLVRRPSGEPDYFIAFIENISDRKHTEMELVESEARFRSLFQNRYAVMLIVDPANGAIIDANPAACSYYGHARESLVGMNIADINTLSPVQIRERMHQAQMNQHNHFEFQHRLADGTLRDVEVFSGPIRIAERDYLFSVIFDISERKHAEKEQAKLRAQFIQAQKMESIGRLAGGVAHDYNNFVGVIIGYAELALARVNTRDPLYEDLQQIHIAAERSRDITRQLLAFARQEIIAPEVLDLNVVVKNMLKILRQLIGQNILLAWLPVNNLWPVLMDPTQVDQLLANLCANARDAIADVGHITIETGMVTFDQAYCADHDGFTPGDYVMLAVRDDGCGMEREGLNMIFEPFFSTKEVGKGAGLGLATVYGIVKQNKGFINVYSEPGQGSVFRIYLPRHSAAIAHKPKPESAIIRGGQGEIVLVVEDNAAILRLVERILTTLNYQVLTARTPSEALQSVAAHQGPIALLVTDVVMPGINGRELADRLQTIYPGLKCLYMSGYNAEIIGHHGEVSTDLHFIQKPFSTRDLAAKVRAALDPA